MCGCGGIEGGVEDEEGFWLCAGGRGCEDLEGCGEGCGGGHCLLCVMVVVVGGCIYCTMKRVSEAASPL